MRSGHTCRVLWKNCKSHPVEISSSSVSGECRLYQTTKLDKTHKVCTKVALYKKSELHAGVDFGLRSCCTARLLWLVLKEEKNLRDFLVIALL